MKENQQQQSQIIVRMTGAFSGMYPNLREVSKNE